MEVTTPTYDQLKHIKNVDVVDHLLSIAIEHLHISSVNPRQLCLSLKRHNATSWRIRLNYGQWLVLGCTVTNEFVEGVEVVQGFPKGKAPYSTLFAKQTDNTDAGLEYIDVQSYVKSQKTTDKRFQRGLTSAHQLFSTWKGSSFQHAHQQELFENLLRLRYRWIGFMEELGTRLVAYRNRQKELIELLIASGAGNGLDDQDANGNRTLLTEIDPFTTVAALNKYDDEKRTEVILTFGRSIGVAAPEFATVHGMPKSFAKAFWYMPYAHQRTASHVNKLWDFFEKVLANNISTQNIADVRSLPRVGSSNLTQAMFWVRPTHFIPFDDKTTSALKRHWPGVNLPDEKNFPTGYLDLCGSLRAGHENDPWLFAAWSELGHQMVKDNEIQHLLSSMIGRRPESTPPEDNMKDLNTILYGPPGTGKTYVTRERALRIIDDKVPSDVQHQQERYRQLIEKGQVRFVTFHQSYAYENFIEGIRPHVSDAGVLTYEVEAGVLKQIAEKATQAWELSMTTPADDPLNGLDRTKVKFWKCSLGQAGSDIDADVYPYCIENNVIAIGYGDASVDLSSATTHEDVERLTKGIVGNASHVRFLRQLAIDMKEGDIVVVPSSVNTIRAIGRVAGPYRFDLDVPEGYCHTRPVEWLHVDASFPVRMIYDGQLTQPAIKPLSRDRIVERHPLQHQSSDLQRFVLIIDEINRGNISNIFGEAITLLEEDKRLNQANNVTVQLPYSREQFCLPPNLYIIGTMNTADRSIALVDMALRRRFVFEEMTANASLLSTNIDGINLQALLKRINDRLELLLDPNHTIGHAYFMGCTSVNDVSRVLVQKIIPLLQEYFYDDLSQIGIVLNDHANSEHPIITTEVLSETTLFGRDLDNIQDGVRYLIPQNLSAEQIVGIYT